MPIEANGSSLEVVMMRVNILGDTEPLLVVDIAFEQLCSDYILANSPAVE